MSNLFIRVGYRFVLFFSFFFFLFIGNFTYAVGPDPTKPYILITPFVSSPSVTNGQKLLIKASIESNFPIREGTARIEGFSSSIQFQLVDGDRKSGFWVASWIANGVTDKNYKVYTTFTDETGHSYIDSSLSFSDPIAGNDSVGDIYEKSQDLIIASSVTLPETAEIVNSLKLYTTNAQGLIRVALYDSTKKIIWQSNVIAAPGVSGWFEIPIKDGSPRELNNLLSGTYWIAVQVDSSNRMIAYESTTNPESGFTQRYLFNAYPRILSQPNYSYRKVSMYMVYNEYGFMKRWFKDQVTKSMKVFF